MKNPIFYLKKKTYFTEYKNKKILIKCKAKTANEIVIKNNL